LAEVQDENLRWRTLWTIMGWTLVVAIIWLSVTPDPPTIHVQNSDKYEHALAYGVLMFWFCQMYSGWKQRAAYGLAWTALGIALEYVQRALGYRTFDVLDMAADAVGVLLGWGLVLLAGSHLLARAETVLTALRRQGR
jgi:VanZ family protein